MEGVCHRVTKQIMLDIFRTKQSRYSKAKERALLFVQIFLSSTNKKNKILLQSCRFRTPRLIKKLSKIVLKFKRLNKNSPLLIRNKIGLKRPVCLCVYVYDIIYIICMYGILYI